MSIKINDLRIYPIKSCGSIALRSCKVSAEGLENDRRYMLVDETGEFISQRSEPQLTLIHLSMNQGSFTAHRPDGTSLDLPIDPLSGKEALQTSITCAVWSDTVESRMHPEGSAWFSAFLNRPVRLVCQDKGHVRAVNAVGGKEGDRLSLADGYPLLLASVSSLAALNERLSAKVSMSRFRANVIVEGAAPFDEDLWSELNLGALPFSAPKLCDRCVVTTINDSSGQKSKEPLATLATFRKWNRAVWFGSNLIPRSLGELKVGDLVHATKVRPHPRETAPPVNSSDELD